MRSARAVVTAAALPRQRTSPEDRPGSVTWPSLGTSDLPPAEAGVRRSGIRAAAVASLLVTVAYLVWRAGWTIDGAALALALPLLALEAHAAVSLAFHTHDLWDVDAHVTPAAGGDGRHPRVAVLIPTYNEPREILLPTIAAAVALQPAHETWVLDDGQRPWVAELAHELGATYRARAEHEHAKAGNINAALPELADAGVELVAVLDADHVAAADFLHDTLPYFADPRTALVQTPQDFYNFDSFEHVERRSGRRYSEQELFYRGLAAGRNAWNAAFWCGTNAVLRLSALLSVGGIATETLTEDIHTTIRLHHRGWTSVYHNAVLARGLAASDASQYLNQRLRWGTGAMQVLRTDNPAVVRGLTGHQRVSYLSTLLGWFDSWRSLGYVVLPLLTLVAGALPIAADAAVFVPVFTLAFLLQRFALSALARGRAPWWQSTLFEFVRMPANLAATLAIVGRPAGRFQVTTKGRSGTLRTRAGAPMLLVVLISLSVAMLLWYAATAAGLTPVTYPVPWVAHASALWAGLNTALLVTAVRRIRALRFATERRASVRFPLPGAVRISDVEAELQDVSLTGLRATVPAAVQGPVPGESVTVILPTSAGAVVLPGVVRSARPESGREVLGVEFDNPPARVQAALALALFRTGITPRLVETPAPAPAA